MFAAQLSRNLLARTSSAVGSSVIPARLARTSVRSAQFTSRRAYSQRPPKNILTSRFLQGLAVGVAGGLTFAIFGKLAQLAGVEADSLDSFKNADINLQPDTDAPAFPQVITVNNTPFLAVATGFRTVTFLKFHVYAVGLFIADADIPTARKILRAAGESNGVHSSPDFATLLESDDRGADIINELLKANVRFAVQIVPVRNTDFSHLRDAFVRSITNHKEAKSLQSNAEFGMSVNEVKRAFSRKRKLHKHDVVTWARDINGGMTAWFGKTDEDKELLGSVPDADVARLFYLNYLTGPKPNSPSLKEHAMKGLAVIAA